MNVVNKIAVALVKAILLMKLSLRFKLTQLIMVLSMQDSVFHLCSASTHSSKKDRLMWRDP